MLLSHFLLFFVVDKTTLSAQSFFTKVHKGFSQEIEWSTLDAQCV